MHLTADENNLTEKTNDAGGKLLEGRRKNLVDKLINSGDRPQHSE